ncbi:MAG TPA: protein kinase [Kofleriaceae bacterium]|nr:protein kinase [Kofleriaceae bacterium]
MGTPGVQAPARLGRYELLARLATGGMGEIFLARLEGAAGFEKLFVVKRILPHLADDARFRGMLIAEARIASKLSHANICQVYELGETDGQLYIVMEYLEGITLLPLLRRSSREGTPLEFGFIGGVLQQTTDALHYAHELSDRTGEFLGIVHRDVTPSNIFLTDAGVAKVLDFGIAKVKDASAQTQTGTVKGKYAYMAPEQLRGASIDRRADVFALGVVVYEMLALRRLFQRKTDYLTFRAVMEQPIPDIRRYRPDVPDSLADVLAKALDRDPDNRYQTARQLGSAVMDALAAEQRAWTQGELGDFVRTNFATEIEKQSEQVASAIHRTKPQGTGRLSMPLIAPTLPEPEHDLDDDDEFLPVDSEIAPSPLPTRRTNPSQIAATDFQGLTPPPFGADSSTGSGAGLVPLAPKTATVVVQKRSILWPLLAIAMVGIAGGALFLVWKQMQQQPPAVVNITTEPADRSDRVALVDSAGSDHDGSAVADVGSGSGSAKPVKRIDSGSATVPRKPKRGPYDEAIQQHRSEISKCAQEHGVPPSNARVTIVVTTTGKAKTISLEPTQLNGTPLGGCIKNVLAGAKFPTAAAEMQVSVALTAT